MNTALRHFFYIFIILVLGILYPALSFAETSDTEKLIRQMTPPSAIVQAPPVKDTMYYDVYYEPSYILQGNRTGRWSELTEMYSYARGGVRAYASLTQYKRFDDRDYTANTGVYISMKNAYLHEEFGVGWNVNYIYRFQNILEYGHKLYKGFYWQAGYNYRENTTNHTHLIYPGLIYYFGDSYMSVDYGLSLITERDPAQFMSVKGNFAITSFLKWFAGAAFGERLYDIYGLDARKECGYILYNGLAFDVYKHVTLRIGYSYSYEKPKFLKRSLMCSMSAKF